MTTSIFDFLRNTVLKMSLAPAARTANTTVTGVGVDLQDCIGQPFAILDVGSVTDGTFTYAIQESHNDNTGDASRAADPYAAVLSLTPPTGFDSPTANTPQVINFERTKRWVRATQTLAGATTGGTTGILLGGEKRRV
jgi:hypothetical protein